MNIQKYGNVQIYMQKNINQEMVKEDLKKVNLCMKNDKVTSNRNVNKDTSNEMKKKYIKATNIQKFA